MQNNYLNINFITYSKKEDIHEEADNIILIVTKEQTDRFEFQKSLAQRIDRAFSQKQYRDYYRIGR